MRSTSPVPEFSSQRDRDSVSLANSSGSIQHEEGLHYGPLSQESSFSERSWISQVEPIEDIMEKFAEPGDEEEGDEYSQSAIEEEFSSQGSQGPSPSKFKEWWNRKLSIENIDFSFVDRCACPNECVQKFTKVDIFRVRLEKRDLGYADEMAQRNTTLQFGLNEDKRCCEPNILGKKVCLHAYCIVTGLNLKLLLRRVRMMLIGNTPSSKGRREGHRTGQDKVNWMKGWISEYVDARINHNPDGSGRRHTIPDINILSLYMEYISAYDSVQTRLGQSHVGQSCFYKAFNDYLKENDVVVLQKSNITTKCSRKMSYIISMSI